MAERTPDDPVKAHDRHGHEADGGSQNVEVAPFRRLTDRRSQPGRRERLAAILHVLGNDAGVPRAAHRGDPTGQEAWKDGWQDEILPAMPPSQSRQPRYFPEFTRNGAGAGDDIK